MRSVPAPDRQNDSDEEVRRRPHYGAVDSHEYKHCVLTLQLRNLERHTIASSVLITVTDSLVDATKFLVTSTNQVATFTNRLVIAIDVLCGVSFLLFVAIVLQFFMNPSM
jgi:hypothetical protein